MQKTKMGISAGLLASIIYFSGLISKLALIILVGYVLLFETGDWIKRAAVKAAVITIVFTLANGVLDVLGYAFDVINSILGIFDSVTFRLYLPLNLEPILTYALRFMEYGVFILLGVKALSQKTVDVSIADGIVGKHYAPSLQGSGEQGAGSAGFCSNCGQAVSLDKQFCGNCGTAVKR